MNALFDRDYFETSYPAVKVYFGRAYHVLGWEAGIMWGRISFDEIVDGEEIYRKQIGVVVRAGLRRYLRNSVQVVRRRG